MRIFQPCVMSLLAVLCASDLPASRSFGIHDTAHRILLADGATTKRFEVKPLVPPSWGRVETVGGQLCFNFSCEKGEKDVQPFYDLPKRFHENAKIQHRYSKRDAEEEKRNKLRARADQEAGSGTPTPNKQRRLSFVAPFLNIGAPLTPCKTQLCPLLKPSVGTLARPRSVVMKASGGGLGFGSSGDPSKRNGGKKDDSRGQSGLSKYKDSNPGTYPEMEMQFTCNKCETRQAKRFTRLAYEEGVVIVKCVGCGVHHLIADNQAYFKDWTGMDKTNVEKMLAEKGEKVDNRLGKLHKGADGTLELRLAQPPEEPDAGSS